MGQRAAVSRPIQLKFKAGNMHEFSSTLKQARFPLLMSPLLTRAQEPSPEIQCRCTSLSREEGRILGRKAARPPECDGGPGRAGRHPPN